MEVNIFRFPTTAVSLFFLRLLVQSDGSHGDVRIYMVPLLPLVLQYVSLSLCLLHLHMLTDCFSSWPVELET